MVSCPKCDSSKVKIVKPTAAELYGSHAMKWRCLNCGYEGVFPEKIIRVRVLISGQVQGVLFRRDIWTRARLHGIAGWVKNLKDGCVDAVFEGEEVKVKKLIEWCKKGPMLAGVEEVKVKREAPKNIKGFEIKSG